MEIITIVSILFKEMAIGVTYIREYFTSIFGISPYNPHNKDKLYRTYNNKVFLRNTLLLKNAVPKYFLWDGIFPLEGGQICWAI